MKILIIINCPGKQLSSPDYIEIVLSLNMISSQLVTSYITPDHYLCEKVVVFCVKNRIQMERSAKK